MKLKVVSSNLSSKGGYVNKLQGEETKVQQLFGTTKTTVQTVTFYTKTDTQLSVGIEDNVNLNDFDIVERPFVPEVVRTTDANGNPLRRITADAPIYLRWLTAKPAVRVQVARRMPMNAQVVKATQEGSGF